MKETGIVKHLDELGRIAIPKEIRRVMRMREGDAVEILTEEGVLCLKKCELKTQTDSHEEFVNDFINDIIDISFNSDTGITRVITIDGSVGSSRWNPNDRFNMNEGIYHALLDAGYVDGD